MKHERSSFAQFALDGDFPIHDGNELFDETQSQSKSSCASSAIALPEWFSNMCEVMWCNTCSCIFYCEMMRRCADSYLSTYRSELACIIQQIGHDAFENSHISLYAESSVTVECSRMVWIGALHVGHQ